MQLNEDQQRQFVSWMNSKGIKSCPLCHVNDWGFGRLCATANITPDGAAEMSGTTVPMVSLICNNCKQLLFFAAAEVGLLTNMGLYLGGNPI